MTAVASPAALDAVERIPRRVPVPGASAATHAASSTTTEIVSDYGRFLELEVEWNDAVDRGGVTHPFLCHEWFRTWWDCFGGGRRSLHVVVVRAGGQVTAIAPLMCEQTQTYGLPIRKIDLLHNDHTPRADFIIAGDAGAAYRGIWRALLDTRRDWDLLQLSRLPSDSGTRTVIEGLAAEERCSTGVWKGDVSPYLTLTGTWDTYLASLSAKFRSNVRNRLTRLTKIGEPRFEVLEDAEAIAAARHDALRLEASGWKADAGTSICSDPAIERFYTQLTGRATARGWLRLLFLTVGGRRIATSYGSCHRGRLFLFKTGYDPEYATCSPFKVLTYFAIQAAYEEGLTEVDFLGDAEPWKLEWTRESRAHHWLYVFSHSWRAQLLHWMKFQMRGPRRAWSARWGAVEGRRREMLARWGMVVPELKKWRA
jgi:CelD/BcsL family acetyltransferase involved in cellulose biosynthesis